MSLTSSAHAQKQPGSWSKIRAISARKRGQPVAARLASAGVVSLAAIIPATAASAAALPPAKGVDPSVAAAASGVSLFYTAANGTVWTAAPKLSGWVKVAG